MSDPKAVLDPASPKRICVVGSLNVDLVATVGRAPAAGETVRATGFGRYAGGKGGNQACAAARLAGKGSGTHPAVQVEMIGRVGSDADGAWLCQELAASGANIDAVDRDTEASTGVAFVTLDREGQNRIVVIPGANERLVPGALAPHHTRLVSADVVLLQLEVPLPTVQTAARVGREKNAIVILDPAPARSLPTSLLVLCDYVTPNENELLALEGAPAADPETEWSLPAITAAARRLLGRGARNVVVKLGERGAILVTPRREQHFSAPPIAVVDTTGAGDAWNGAFAVALAEGRTPEQAAERAMLAATLSVGRLGAQTSFPTRHEVDARLAPA